MKLAVVNARHVKQVPGRKTDIADAHWLAILARSGLLRGGFVPPQPFRDDRLMARQLQKLTGIASGEKNRLHKRWTDAGIRLSVVVSEGYGKTAKAMIRGLLNGETPEQLLAHAARRTRCGLQDKFKSLLIRRGRKRAIFAIADKLLKMVLLLIQRGDYYRDAATDHEAPTVQRNAPRWIKRLIQYGYISA